MKLNRKQYWTYFTKFLGFFFRLMSQHIFAALTSQLMRHFRRQTIELILKLGRKQVLNVLCQVCVFRTDLLTKIIISIFFWLRDQRILAGNNHWYSTSFANLAQVVFFGADPSTKMVDLVFDWLGHFQFPVLQKSNGFCRNLAESTYSTFFTKFVSPGWSFIKDERPGPWLAETFSTSHLKQLNKLWWNVTESNLPSS